MNYKKIYDQLIEKRRQQSINRTKDNKHCEYHHIVPLCIGGENTPRKAEYNHEGTNLICLTVREHIFAHFILTKIYDSEKLVYAANYMCVTRHYNSRVATQMRIKANEARKGKNHPFYGKHRSEETRRKMSESAKGRPPSYGMLGKHHAESTRQKMREAWKKRKLRIELAKVDKYRKSI